MNTKVLIIGLAALTLSVGAVACGKKKSTTSSGAPAFADPAGFNTQLDRMGRPAINTLIHKIYDTSGGASDAFNAATPAQDVAAFGGALGPLVALAHACPSAGVAAALLPDVLTFDATATANYAALNGRALADDAFDATVNALYSTNGGTTYCNAGVAALATGGDHIAANDKSFQTTFPFLAAPF